MVGGGLRILLSIPICKTVNSKATLVVGSWEASDRHTEAGLLLELEHITKSVYFVIHTQHTALCIRNHSVAHI